jgi:hypothetical protein
MFITAEEYQQLGCDPQQFIQIKGDEDVNFIQANSAASALIEDLSGVSDPGDDEEDIATVDARIKMCAAWIVTYILFTPSNLASVTAESFSEYRARYDEAKVILRGMRQRPSGDSRTAGYSLNDLAEY